jgi:hypothetical protein
VKGNPGEQPDAEHPDCAPQDHLAIDPQQLGEALDDVIEGWKQLQIESGVGSGR